MTNRQRPYARIVAALEEASRAAAEQEIDLFRIGRQREIIIADRLGHTLPRGRRKPLIDALGPDGRKYSYLASHVGKKAQLFLSGQTRSEQQVGHGAIDGFVIAFFSEHDACKVITIWEVAPQAIWREIQKQAHGRTNKVGRPQGAWFSEAWLKDLSVPQQQDVTPEAKLVYRADGLI
jgi:hypothetical protein